MLCNTSMNSAKANNTKFESLMYINSGSNNRSSTTTPTSTQNTNSPSLSTTTSGGNNSSSSLSNIVNRDISQSLLDFLRFELTLISHFSSRSSVNSAVAHVNHFRMAIRTSAWVRFSSMAGSCTV